MSQEREPIRLISLLADEFERRGWRDPGDAALEIAKSVAHGAQPSAAAETAPARFLAINSLRRSEVASAIKSVVGKKTGHSAGSAVPAAQSTQAARRARANFPAPATTGSVKERVRTAALIADRMIAALAMVVIGTWGIWIGPSSLGLNWVMEHDNRLALQALAQSVVVLVSLGFATWRWPIAAVAAAPFFALLGLLGQ